ncbi:hypothetical protein [Promicromonospora sp. NFX87]|uniref:hypothetical protein n=1 Tax=Promicromonospora sp. NFX87 TaxID=3402691 RepID=UPI003AFB734F
MAYITYGTFTYSLPEHTASTIEADIERWLRSGELGTFMAYDGNGQGVKLFVTPGVPISVHFGKMP